MNEDEYGQAFIQDLENANIAYKGVIKQNDLPTDVVIFLSPDGERTMATHIGIGSQLHPDELTEDSLQGIDHIYIILWDHDLTKQTLKKVGKIAKAMNIETSLSLSILFVLIVIAMN